MPRPKVWPPKVYAHGSGRDRIRVNGIDYWLGKSGSAEAKREYARLVTELAGQGGGPPARAKAWPTLAELVGRWESERAASSSEKEQRQFRKALGVLLLGGRRSLRTDQFGIAELVATRTEMLSLPWGGKLKKGVGWCRNVANRQTVRIRTVWRWAEEAGLAPKGSWNHLRTLRAIPAHDRSARNTERTRPATAEHLEAILKRVWTKKMKAMLRLQWLTGMRSGEVRRMRAGEVDRSGEVWLYRPAKHKMSWKGQSRVVPIGPESQAILGPWLKGKAAGDHVFLTRLGKPYTANGYGVIASRAAKKVGLPWFRCYCLRHGAKQRITREFGLDVARAMLGQKHLGTTNDYGDALDLDAAVRAAKKAG